MSKSNTLTFQRFGRQWVVVGPAVAIAKAVDAGQATVTRADGTSRTVEVQSRYVTKAGKAEWTYRGVETAAFVPVDDRPERQPEQPEQQPEQSDAVAAMAATLGVDPAALAALMAASQQQPEQPEQPASKPASQPGKACQACGKHGKRSTHRGAAAQGRKIYVCGTCKTADADTVIARADKRAQS